MSNDYPVGAPFNIAQFALLTMMVAQCADMEPFEFIYTIGDCHAYLDQLPLIDEQLSREPRPLPTVYLNPEIKSIFDFKDEDFTLEGYNPWPKIDYPVSM